jgi:hypothetical protein
MHYNNIEWRDRVDLDELRAIDVALSKDEKQSLVWVREVCTHAPTELAEVSVMLITSLSRQTSG